VLRLNTVCRRRHVANVPGLRPPRAHRCAGKGTPIPQGGTAGKVPFMSSARLVTFRSELKSSIADFLHDADMTCAQTEEALVALVVSLADLREEGAQLFPRVLICDDRDAVMKNIQGTSPLVIGTGPRTPTTVARALKKCAPLADHGWAIWISRGLEDFTFGVFRQPSNPTSLDLRRTLLDTEPSSELPALLIAQFAPGKVELISAGKPGLRIHLSGERADLETEDAQDAVVRWWSQDLNDEHLQSSFSSFMGTLLRDLLRKGHGALIAVAPTGSDVASFVEDAVILEEPVDLAYLVNQHAENESSNALAELRDYSDLLSGMLGSDGIVLVDTAGRVLAFNWFIQTDTAVLSPRDQQGGARHRAFAALSKLVQDGVLSGSFIRSSDGGEKAYDGA
jgi:hypothetical protein